MANDADENQVKNLELAKLKLQKEIWEKAVDTQMHFNQMSVKSRQLGLSFVMAALALASILLSRGEEFLIALNFFSYSVHFHVSGVLVLISALALFVVRQLDLYVYHRMLRGAVTFGEEFECRVLRDKLMETPKGMTEFISLYSRHRTVNKEKMNGDYIYKGTRYEPAEDKLKRFYKYAIVILITMGIVLIISFPGPVIKNNQPSTTTNIPYSEK